MLQKDAKVKTPWSQFLVLVARFVEQSKMSSETLLGS
jgi:hypothetical protein